MLEFGIDLVMLIFDSFEVLYNFLIGLFKLLKPSILSLYLFLNFELMIDGDFFHKGEV